MKKLSCALFAAGLLSVVIGFAIGPGVPYQDPTPEMLAKDRSEEARSKRCIVVGGVAFASGAIAFLISKFKRSN